MIDALPSNLQGARDRALLVIGFAGGFRRSELAALDVEDRPSDGSEEEGDPRFRQRA